VPVGTQLDHLISRVNSGTRIVSLAGLTSTASKAFVLSRLHAATRKRFAVVAPSNAELAEWAADLLFWGVPALPLPSFDADPYSGSSPHARTQEQRAVALWQLQGNEVPAVVMSARSLVQRTVSPDEAARLGIEAGRDQELPPDRLVKHLIAVGYVREDPVVSPGQFSVRGGIIDVWSPDADIPLRLEFFGDHLDSIRSFNPETQLTIAHLTACRIAPMRELAAAPQDLKDWAFFAKERFRDERFRRYLKDRTDLAAEGEAFSGWEFVLPLSSPLRGSTFAHLGDMLLILDEPSAIENTLSNLYDDLQNEYHASDEAGDIVLEPAELLLTIDELRTELNVRRAVELRALGRTAADTDQGFAIDAAIDTGPAKTASAPLFLFPATQETAEIELRSRSTRKFHGDVAAFAAEFDREARIVVSTTGMAERLAEMLREYNVPVAAGTVEVGSLSAGFEMPDERLAIYSESDIFGEDRADERRSGPAAKRQRSRLGAFISDFRDLKPGDYVVHVDHGIGRFDGLKTIDRQGAGREFMLLVYADDAKLFVPVERMDLVSRYSSGEATQPSLDRLGGLGWQKTKAKAKRAMRDMADELLKLYAERKLVKGFAFLPDSPWQHEFEDAFPYELTPDQDTAIADVKSDMEAATPMDRLIIGDVGYGKTEVAMRAAFKAVMNGKQAAVLAPTTVLAYQHFETFKKRFAAFPAKVELLSRFRSTKEQKAVADAAGKGEVDVLIGTHRLLSNDVKLANLGLVIVDEEQRFGVAHKEKLKQWKKKVDVLTLSATPIPRTLNMSLLGMRDMSVIETPPRDRLAINTQVVQFSESVIRSAIELELSRSGQIFFIHNRVESIEPLAVLIKKIVPAARIAIGHGQMNEKEMERVMLDFIDYKYDVLVATTIIENGIDIPRANTIIINRADNYGLSQLYQLRGRVGRSNRRAYAYLLIPSELELTPIARRRLSAIREFSDLGAGFRLAALDLELRGAGNILGGQQSGHLDALGFDLYTKMLERTIAEIRGEDIADEIGVSINVGVDVSIPAEYVNDASQRLRMYKRIASADGDEALRQIHLEVEDRYGRLPRSVEDLFEYARLRKLGETLGIVSIDRSGSQIAMKLGEASRVKPDELMRFLDGTQGALFSPNGILRVPIEAGGSAITIAIDALLSVSGRSSGY